MIYNDSAITISSNDYYAMDKKKISSLPEIVDYLIQVAWTESSHSRKIAIEGLIQIAGSTTYRNTDNTNTNTDINSTNIFIIQI